MADGTDKLTPDIIRFEAAAAGINDLVGKWIVCGANVGTETGIIVSAVVIKFPDKVPEVKAFVLSGEAYKALNRGWKINDGIVSRSLVMFASETNIGHFDDGPSRVLPFHVAIDQSKTPDTLSEQLKFMKQYPVGEVIDIPPSVADNYEIGYKKGIIYGHTLEIVYKADTAKVHWTAVIELADAQDTGNNNSVYAHELSKADAVIAQRPAGTPKPPRRMLNS